MQTSDSGNETSGGDHTQAIEGATTPKQIAFNDEILPHLRAIEAAAQARGIAYFFSAGLGGCPTCPPGSTQWIYSSGLGAKPSELEGAPDDTEAADSAGRIMAHRQLTQEGGIAMRLSLKYMAASAGLPEGLGGLLGALLGARARVS